MKKTLIMVALALGLIATSTFGQTLVCTERRVDGTTNNWYTSEGRMVVFDGQSRLACDFRRLPGEPAGTIPIVYFYLTIGGSPTSDSFAGTGEFTFPPQADGVEIQVHYQKAGDDWDVGTTAHYAGSQVAYCPNMVVPKGYMISFVVRVAVADWVPDGTPINVELRNLSGLYGVTLGEIPEFQISPNTGPWRMTWWKRPVIKGIYKSGLDKYALHVGSPPHYWSSDWSLEASPDLKSWARVTSHLVPAPEDIYPVVNPRKLEVLVNPDANKQFFRFVFTKH